MSTIDEQRFTYREWYARLRAPVRDHSHLDTALGPALADYLAWKRLSGAAERTLDQYERDLARLALSCPDRDEKSLDTEDLMIALNIFPPGSWRRVRAAWSDFFRWAVRFDRRDRNPVERLPKMRPVQPEVQEVFTVAEQQALVNAAAASLWPELDRARMLLFLGTGARKGEARVLRIGDIDLASRAITLRGKGGKERLVPVRGDVVSAVDVALLEPVSGLGRTLGYADHLWFPGNTQGRRVLSVYPDRVMSQRGFHEWWVRMVAESGVRYRKPHMARHTYATDALDAGVDLFSVKELLGHSSTSVTEVYLHSSRSRLERAAEQIAAFRRLSGETTV